MPPLLNLKGKQFGYWTVLEQQGFSGKHSQWLCRCKCGTIRLVLGASLNSGQSKSCGCLQQETARIHGLSDLPEYGIWRNMLSRCEDSTDTHYALYGGRGIGVCERWHDFVLFLEDMGPRPSPDLSLERVDNNAWYFKDNCIWATATAQARNRRSNLHITINGETHCLREWAERFGHTTKKQYKLLWQRINRDGWSIDAALK